MRDSLNELCEWLFIWTSDPMALAAFERHRELHERKAREATVIGAVLHKANTNGFSSLTEREEMILRAYSVGADIPC